MKRAYFVVVERTPAGCWGWAVWIRDGIVANGYAPKKALALKIGRAVRDVYEKYGEGTGT